MDKEDIDGSELPLWFTKNISKTVAAMDQDGSVQATEVPVRKQCKIGLKIKESFLNLLETCNDQKLLEAIESYPFPCILMCSHEIMLHFKNNKNFEKSEAAFAEINKTYHMISECGEAIITTGTDLEIKDFMALKNIMYKSVPYSIDSDCMSLFANFMTPEFIFLHMIMYDNSDSYDDLHARSLFKVCEAFGKVSLVTCAYFGSKHCFMIIYDDIDDTWPCETVTVMASLTSNEDFLKYIGKKCKDYKKGDRTNTLKIVNMYLDKIKTLK